MTRLYLGAGKDHRDGYINIDSYPFPGIDIVTDLTKGIPYADMTVDFVMSIDFMEHLPPEAKVPMINEIWRVLKPDGIMEHWIPNAGSKNDFGSPSHLSHWNLQQFEHFDINSYRYKLDFDYEGSKAKFTKIIAEEVNPQPDVWGNMCQSIHVRYRSVRP